MKKKSGFTFIVIPITVMILMLSFSSCKKDTQSIRPADSPDKSVKNSAASGAPIKVDLANVYVHVEDANGQPPVGDATPLYDNRGHTPVMAPDGHQVILGEYNMAHGWANIKCINMGTHVVVHAQGLIPNGVYTIWTLTFKSPGFDGTFDNLIRNGALGAPDGSENAFVASPDGTASFSVIMPAEPLSLFGSVGMCLGSEYETHLVAAYHSDFMTHGGAPGDPSTWVVQFGFFINGSDFGM